MGFDYPSYIEVLHHFAKVLWQHLIDHDCNVENKIDKRKIKIVLFDYYKLVYLICTFCLIETLPDGNITQTLSNINMQWKSRNYIKETTDFDCLK